MASGKQKHIQNLVEVTDTEYKELAIKGTQRAKECIDFLKFSEGLVRRDIDLIRMQLEIKLKKLESRLQAELRNIVETETAKLERFMENAKTVIESNTFSISPERLSSLKTFAFEMERKRLKFEANAILEKSLDEITSFGKIVVEKVDSEKSNTTSKLNSNNKRKNDLPNGYKRTLSDSSHELSSRLENPPINSEQNNIQLHSSLNDTKANLAEQKGNRKDRKELEYVGEKTVPRRIIDNGNRNKSTNIKNNKSDAHEILGHQPAKEDTGRVECKRNHVKHSAVTSDTEWMHADPMSVLRALKQQTSRTEENLKALRDMKGANETKTVLTHDSRTRDKSGGAIEYNARGVSIADDSNFSTCETDKHKTLNQTRQNDEVFNVNGRDAEDDEYSHMDKVSRANEIWFGRERRRRREDFGYRRTRSLSPKTVRFRLEDPQEVVNERVYYADTDCNKVLDHARSPHGYRTTQIEKTWNVYFENGKNKRYPCDQNMKQEKKRVDNHRNTFSSSPIYKTEALHTDTEMHKTNENQTVKSGSCKISIDSPVQYWGTEKCHGTIYNEDCRCSKYNAPKAIIRPGEEEINIEQACQITENPNTNYTNSISQNSACISNRQEERRQKLRDKRKRNNTISVITASDIAKISSKENFDFVTATNIAKLSLSDSVQNSNVPKSKMDRQKLPSFREMLFSD